MPTTNSLGSPTARVLEGAGLAILSGLELDGVLASLLDSLAQLVPYDSASVLLIDGDGRLRAHARRGYEHPALASVVTLDLQANAIIAAIFTTHDSILIPDTRLDSGWEQTPGGEGILCWIGVPLVARGSFLGIYSVDKRQAGFFTDQHRRFVESLAPQTALAIQNAELYRRERATREESERLRAATTALSSTLDPQQVLALILSELRALIPYDSAAIMELKGERLEIVGGHGFTNLADLLGASFDVAADNPNSEVVRTRAPVLIDDVPARYPGFAVGAHAATQIIRSWLGVPLLFADRLIGMLTLDKGHLGFFTPTHVRLAEAFAAQAALALENASLYAAARRELHERQEAEAKYHAFVEQAPYGVVAVSSDERIVLVNAEAERLFGYARAEVLGRHIDVLMHDALARGKDDGGGREPGNSSRRRLEIALRHKSGETRQVVVSMDAIASAGMATPLNMMVFVDITERKQLESQLLQAQKMEAVGRLAGGVAHDFNNALGVILGYTELLLRHAAESQRGKLEQIVKAAQRASGLTRQLLAFSRKQVMVPSVLDLSALVSNLESMLGRLIGEHISLTIVAGEHVGMVKADPGQLEQVVMNLCVNARDAMPGGGALRIETANAEIATCDVIQGEPITPGPYVRLAVSDSGTGIGKDILSKIFEPFFTTKDLGKGTGLGLAIVYGIVKEAGGSVCAASAVGVGTTISVYLPRVEEDVAAQVTNRETVAERAWQTILLVEDEAALREIAREILEEEGYRVLAAANADEAIAISKGHSDRIHLLLTDVVMPGMHGRALSELLAGLRPDLPVLYMSGYTDDVIAHSGVLELGVRLIEKPFSASSLLEQVRAALEQAA